MPDPVPTGKNDTLDLVDMNILLPWIDNQPFVISFVGSDIKYVMAFSTPEKLLAHMTLPTTQEVLQERYGHTNYNIKQAEDIRETLASIWEQGLEIMLDPWHTDQGKTRFTQLQKPEA